MKDRWFNKLPFSLSLTFVNSNELNKNSRVSDLFSSIGVWDIQKLGRIFGEDLAMKIIRIPISGIGGVDRFSWGSGTASKVHFYRCLCVLKCVYANITHTLTSILVGYG